MTKKFLLLAFALFVFLYPIPYTLYPVSAVERQPEQFCKPGVDTCAKDSDGHPYVCRPIPDTDGGACKPSQIQDIFGKIEPPDALKGFIQKDPTGGGGLSLFFSNLVTLIYGIAAIVLIFMILWGAFDWMTAEGDKEKLERARNKIMNAIIGILLFAAAFGIIRVLGQFTGFKFFVGQEHTQSIPASVTVPANTNPSARPRASIQPFPCQITPSLCTPPKVCLPDIGADRYGCKTPTST